MTEVQSQNCKKHINFQKSKDSVDNHTINEKTLTEVHNKESFKLNQSSIKSGRIENRLSASHEVKHLQPEFFHNIHDLESKVISQVDKVKHEIYTTSDNRIKQYGMLFQFISTNLKEINDMVNIDSKENPQANYKEKKKFREKDEDSNKDLSGLNKIDEVNSNKVSSMSSFKMQKSIRNSNNSSNIIKNSNSNSHHNENINILENKNLLKEKMLSIHSKVSNNVSSVNSENIKQIFEESLMGKSYLSDELNSFKNNDKRRNNEVYTNFNNKIKGKKSKLLNNLKFKNDSNSIIHKDKTFKNDSNDLDKTKEYLPFNEFT